MINKHSKTSWSVMLTPALALPMADHTPPTLSFGVGNIPVGGTGRIGDMPVGYRYQIFRGRTRCQRLATPKRT